MLIQGEGRTSCRLAPMRLLDANVWDRKVREVKRGALIFRKSHQESLRGRMGADWNPDQVRTIHQADSPGHQCARRGYGTFALVRFAMVRRLVLTYCHTHINRDRPLVPAPPVPPHYCFVPSKWFSVAIVCYNRTATRRALIFFSDCSVEVRVNG